MIGESEKGLSREDIQAEKIKNLNRDDLIRLFSMRLATYHKRHDYSREKCVGEVALEFCDDYGVNILQVLDEVGYVHPDGYAWSIQPFDEETIQKYDPVYPESTEEGGTLDVRPGDLLKVGDDRMLMIGVDDPKFVGMNKSGKIDSHLLAMLRNLFTSSKYDASLVRDGEVIRGVDADEVTA